MKIKSDQLKVDGAAGLAQRVRLVDVRTLGIKAQLGNIDPAVASGPLGWVFLPMTVEAHASGGQVRALIPVTLNIVAAPQAESPVAALGVLLQMEYLVSEPNKPIDAKALASFVGISGCMHAWPYIRAEIQHLSTKLGLPPLVLPPLVSGGVAALVKEVVLHDVNAKPRTSPKQPTRKRRHVRKSKAS